MKTMKAVCTATVLALTLSVSAFAGDISSPGAPKSGDIGTPGAVSTEPTTSDATTVTSDVEMSALADILLALASMF
jgi:hypothetical protein